jgi:predicted DNA-binding transcriptional regulator YafY/transposase-like protein
MKKIRLIDYMGKLPDNDACLEWLKNQLYPQGIACRNCKKITKHHKLSGRPGYICDNCGTHVYPAARTIFHKSAVPLKTWFAVISQMYDTKCTLSAREIQREYRVAYNTALRMLKKVREFLQVNASGLNAAVKIESPGITNNTLDFYITSTKEFPNIATKKEIFRSTMNSSSPTPVLHHPPMTYSKSDKNMKGFNRKKDRNARLLELQVLLWQYPDGLEITRIAQMCGVNERTIYRDLETLESILKVPIWSQGLKRGIVEGYFVPPIILNQIEAMNIFLAIRLMQNFSGLYNPSMVSTFFKLNAIVPSILRKQIQNILEYMDKLPRNDNKMINFNKLAEAWLSQHRVRIQYRRFSGENIEEYIVEPYFIEPDMSKRSNYMIAYCPSKREICTFRTDLIIGDVIIEKGTYEIPSNFNAIDYFGSSWGIFIDEKPQTIKLLFSKRIGKGIMETVWHPSQTMELQKDKSLLMTLRVRNTIDLQAWILGWGNDVEVLEPLTFRDQIKGMIKSMMDIYTF